MKKSIQILLYTPIVWVLVLAPNTLWAHSHSEHSSKGPLPAQTFAEGFVVESENLELHSAEIEKRIEGLLLKVEKIYEKHGVRDRPYKLITPDQLLPAHRNAAADILLETLEISLDYVQEGLSCVGCHEEEVLPFVEQQKNKIQEMKQTLQEVYGTELSPFEKLEAALQIFSIKYQIKKNELLGHLGHFLKSAGIKVSGDLAEIYGERGSLALTLVFLTWIPYTVVSEAVEHSIIGPFAVFCMTSQILYFSILKSVFNFFTNSKNFLAYKFFSKKSDVLLSDVLNLWFFKNKLRHKFVLALDSNYQNVASRRNLKKRLHVDFLSRIQNIFWGFSNSLAQRLHTMGLKRNLNSYDLHKIRADSFLYQILKTPSWIDLMSLEMENREDRELVSESESLENLETLLMRLWKNDQRTEAYLIFQEMFLVLDVLRGQLSGALRVHKEMDALSLRRFLSYKMELGRIFSLVQKIKFVTSLELLKGSQEEVSVSRVLDSYQDIVILLNSFFSNLRKEVHLKPLHRAEFSQPQVFKAISQESFGLITRCESFFLQK